MADRPGDRPPGEEGGSYAVPPQYPAPPDVAKPARGAGPPLLPPEDRAAALWGPASEAPAEPDRWARGAYGAGGTALLDRPTTARRPVVGAPVRPLPPAPAQSWDWERSHGLRNALIAAAAILLVGSLIAALVVFRNRDDDRQGFVEPPPATLPADVTLQPIAPTEGTVASVPAPSIVPVTPPTTAAPPAPPPTPPPTAAPTTRATSPPTTMRPTPTVTASPPYAGCPPCPTTPPTRTTVPPSSTSSSTTSPPRG